MMQNVFMNTMAKTYLLYVNYFKRYVKSNNFRITNLHNIYLEYKFEQYSFE